jgi:hypothetical protein
VGGATRGRALQLDPIQPTWIAPGNKRLKPKQNELVSSFASKFKLRRYNVVVGSAAVKGISGRGLHSFTFPLNLSSL